MRNLLKVLVIILLSTSFTGFAQEKADMPNPNPETPITPPPPLPPSPIILPANNLDLLHTAHMLGYVFKWYQDELNPHSFINPFVIAAVGRPANGMPTTTAKEIDEWIFYSTLMHSTQAPVYHLEARFKKGLFEPVMLHKYPLPGVEFLSLMAVKMPLEEAIELVQNAGFKDPFIVVDLFKPLHPSAEEIVYVFTTEKGKHIFVGTVSKKVFTEGGEKDKTPFIFPSERFL